MNTKTATPDAPQSFESNVRDIINESVRIEVQQRLIALAQHEAQRPSTMAACGRLRTWVADSSDGTIHGIMPSDLLADLYAVIEAAEAK